MKPEDFGIGKYKFRLDGTLDVFQDVNLIGFNLKELPFKFGKIDGDFNCYGNKLTSLTGAPEIVDGDFICHWNNLKDLKYSPKIVNGDFVCNINNLKSLEDLDLNGITGKIYTYENFNLKLTEKEQLWMSLNPDKLVFY